MESTVFAGKTLLITGGTGSFGNTVLKHFLSTDIGEIRIFSRDEKKQDDMRHDYQLKYPELSGKIKFYIGDVRNPDSLRGVMRGVDYIFHAAALKQVPSCEFFPMEAVRTNVLGTDNVLTAAIDAGVKKVVCLSTDKAAYPINAMGISKAMMEKVIGAKARTVKAEATTICCTRYGNVMASRGSVIPLFIDQIKAGKPITITDGSAVVTGMILALNMPPEIPIWIPMLGGVFAIIVVKQLFGGLGQNFMNPALAARCFLLISFASYMNDFTSAAIGFDSISGATPLAAMRAGSDVDLVAMILGRIPGTIGEVSSVALLIGAVYMIVRKVISPRIPLIYIGTVAVFVFIFGGFDIMYTVNQIFAGGLIFGAFFMATDYVTSPITPTGKIIYGIVLGVLTGIFRIFGASAEGVSYAIIFSNILVPLIERVTIPKAFGIVREKGGDKS